MRLLQDKANIINFVYKLCYHQERYFKELERFRKQIKSDFFLETERRVFTDNVIVINGVEYEVYYQYTKQKLCLHIYRTWRRFLSWS